ncbi:MAG: fasciclin domain-containing protein [Spirosomataceae bacterium]
MKNYIFSLLFLLIGLLGCKQDDPQPKSMSDVLLDQPDLSMLRAAIEYSGLQDAFKTSSLTLFAPNDDAFNAAGITNVTVFTPEQVRALLRNHILTQKLPTETMPLGQNNPIKTFLGTQLFLSNIDAVPYLNQAKGIRANLVATNGVIHIMDNIVPIPTKTLAQIIKASPDFSLFREASRRATLSDPRLAAFADTIVPTPSQTGYTMFLPTNQAMIAAKLSKDEIAATSPIILARVVSYHIALSRFFSTLMPTGTLPMFDASNTTSIDARTRPIKITGRGNPVPAANVTKTDITATDGVIHVIDKVLIP